MKNTTQNTKIKIRYKHNAAKKDTSQNIKDYMTVQGKTQVKQNQRSIQIATVNKTIKTLAWLRRPTPMTANQNIKLPKTQRKTNSLQTK